MGGSQSFTSTQLDAIKEIWHDERIPEKQPNWRQINDIILHIETPGAFYILLCKDFLCVVASSWRGKRMVKSHVLTNPLFVKLFEWADGHLVEVKDPEDVFCHSYLQLRVAAGRNP